MAAMSRQSVDVKDKSGNHFSSDFDDLKNDFTQLREDVTKLMASIMGTGKNGADARKDEELTAVGDIKECLIDIKDRGAKSVERIGHKIGEHSLMSAAIAFAVGFVAAKMLSKR